MKHKLFPGLWSGSSIHIILQLMLAFEQEYPEAYHWDNRSFSRFCCLFHNLFTRIFLFSFCFSAISKDAAEISNSPALMHAFPNINISLFFCEKIKRLSYLVAIWCIL